MAELKTQAEHNLQYLPSGALWQSEQVQSLFVGFNMELVRLKNTAQILFGQTFPSQATTYLSMHEADYGLPKKCNHNHQHSGSTQNRKEYLLTTIRTRGGQKITDYKKIAKDMGYGDVTIKEFDPFVCGLSQCGSSNTCGAPSQRHHWQINVPNRKISYFRCGQSECGAEHLGKVETADDLICAISLAQPTQTKPKVTYQGG